MTRFVLTVVALFLSANAFAQEYDGKWTAMNPAGKPITLTLEQTGPGGVSGKLEGNGHVFDVEAEIRADGIQGLVMREDALVHLTGRIHERMLWIVLREPGPDGLPDDQTRRIIRFTR